MDRRDIAACMVLSTETFEGTYCWGWIGHHRREDGRPIAGREYAYRVIYEHTRGPIPANHSSHHRCERTWCINPWHIEVMPQGAHIKKHDLPGDWGQRDKTHCPAGHPYDDSNTYVWRNERQCRACRRAAVTRYQSKLRGLTPEEPSGSLPASNTGPSTP